MKKVVLGILSSVAGVLSLGSFGVIGASQAAQPVESVTTAPEQDQVQELNLNIHTQGAFLEARVDWHSEI